MSDSHLSPIIPTSAAAVKMIQEQAATQRAVQIESEEDLSQYFEVAAFNPGQRVKQFKELHDIKTPSSSKGEKTSQANEKTVLSTEEVTLIAEQIQEKNYELNAKTLLILREQVLSSKTEDEILEKTNAIYPDASLADEALDFLIQTAPGMEQKNRIDQAKQSLNASRQREIIAGRNMGVQAREFAKSDLGAPTFLRDLYRDITGNPREPLKLFSELTDQFQFEKLKTAITFLLHALGSDLKAKGSSIPKGELKRLIDETRSLQGILGIFQFFQSRMNLIQRQFDKHALMMPSKMNFEALAKTFVKLLAERYINTDKILQTAKLLGIADEIAAQMIVYAQMREGLKQIAPRYYRNPQHKEDLSKSFLELLEELEEDLEQEEEDL